MIVLCPHYTLDCPDPIYIEKDKLGCGSEEMKAANLHCLSDGEARVCIKDVFNTTESLPFIIGCVLLVGFCVIILVCIGVYNNYRVNKKIGR